MWPDGSVVVRHRIVTHLARSNRPDAPPGERCFICQPGCDATRTLYGCDSGKKAMARVRRSHPAWLLSAIECECIGRKFVAPKAFFKSSAQDAGLLRQIARPCIITKEFSQPSGHQLGSVNVALHFAQRDRSLGRRAVRVENRIVRVLPTLVDKTEFRPASVFHEAVSIDIAVMVNPSECTFDVRPNTLDERAISRAL